MKTPQKPLENIRRELGIQADVWFKFENKHHYGSHKGRSIPFMIDEYVKLGKQSFVISSSGNAALAALRFVNAHNKNKPSLPLTLQIFVGESIEENKLAALKNEQGQNITMSQVQNPKQSALRLANETGVTWLRSSTDSLAVAGYLGLAEELAKIPNLSAIFIAASSGTAAEGLQLGFKKLELNPQIHIVQTDFCHPLANFFFEKTGKKIIEETADKSLADAIVDKIGRRKESILNSLLESKGSAWVVNENEIKNATELATETSGEPITANGALALAGLKKATASGLNFEGSVVCIIGGP